MRWSEQVRAVTGVDAWDRVETDLVLDMAREVAHGTERRFAPLTAYALGVAVGSRLGEDAVSADGRHEVLADLVTRLLASIEAVPDD